jgi:hypothetical protein
MAQTLVSHLTPAEVTKAIADINAAELLSTQDGPDKGSTLVVCQKDADTGRRKAGAAEALQKIADLNSKKVREEQRRLEKEAKAAEATAAAKNKKPD